MHNKFAIIDELVLVTGSFNWTSQAVSMNQENLIAIENRALIKEYKSEFERVWIQYAPNILSIQTCKQRLVEEEKSKLARLEKMRAGKVLKQQEKIQSKKK